jgi:hypothetical protein
VQQLLLLIWKEFWYRIYDPIHLLPSASAKHVKLFPFPLNSRYWFMVLSDVLILFWLLSNAAQCSLCWSGLTRWLSRLRLAEMWPLVTPPSIGMAISNILPFPPHSLPCSVTDFSLSEVELPPQIHSKSPQYMWSSQHRHLFLSKPFISSFLDNSIPESGL